MPDSHERSTPTAPHPNGSLEELQELLFATERERLDRLEDRLKNSVIDAPLVANVLPEAIELAIESHEKHMSDTISPLMGPAIRKAVAAALQDAVQAMNRTLDHRKLAWHWEALRTGRPFWQVVLAHTVKYRVERVFLFFREDGIHLSEVHRQDVQPFELGKEDLVSSMFSAIQIAVQKFAHDEFQATDDAPMEEFKMGDGLTVLIEQGPKAVLAAVVRGVPPSSLRTSLKDALDSIHVKLSEALQNFLGDKQPFEAARPYLEACLLQEESESIGKTGSTRGELSPALVVLLILLVGSLALWGSTSYLEWRRGADEKERWAYFQDKAREKPGIHVTSIVAAGGKNGKTIVLGLRDPLSDDPLKIAQEVGLSAEAIDFQLEPYLSLAPELIERRASDRQRLNQRVQEIEAQQFDFETGSAVLPAESELDLQELRQAIQEVDTLAQQLGHRLRIEIHGNTTKEGSDEMNHRLAVARAQGVLSALGVERFPATDFLPIAESVGPSATGEIQGAKPLRARQVSFHVTVNDSGWMGPRP